MPDDRRSFFDQHRDAFPVTSRHVVGEWAFIACQRDPWRSMPLDDLLGELPTVTSVLFGEVARHDDLPPSVLELVARSHGSYRRRQAVSCAVLIDESGILVEAVRGAFLRGGVSEAITEDLMALMQSDLKLVRRAMTAGYLDGPSERRR